MNEITTVAAALDRHFAQEGKHVLMVGIMKTSLYPQ